MTELLISVRSVEEARLALAAAVDVIDIKEPRRGPLGAADPEIVSEILATLPHGVPVSVAGGELRENAARVPFSEDFKSPPNRVLWSKVGLSDCDAWPAWRGRWTAWRQALPRQVQPVAVIYADRARAHAPSAQEILAAAKDNGCGGVLIDTFFKLAGGLLDHLALDDLVSLAAEIADSGLWFALAGSLDFQSLSRVLPLRPRYVAVRGAVCQSGRTEQLDPLKVAQWVDQVKSHNLDSMAGAARSVE